MFNMWAVVIRIIIDFVVYHNTYLQLTLNSPSIFSLWTWSWKGTRNRISPWWWLTFLFSSIFLSYEHWKNVNRMQHTHTPHTLALYMQWKWYHFEWKNGCFSFHDSNELISDFVEMRIWLSPKPRAKTISKSNFSPTRS